MILYYNDFIYKSYRKSSLIRDSTCDVREPQAIFRFRLEFKGP